MTLEQLTALFSHAGCTKLYAKPLSENDNSKNQVYFGPGFGALNLFPNQGIEPDTKPGSPIFKAKLRFGWLGANGAISDSPGAQLILYPQYPEVRFSGFLRGSSDAPSELMRGRLTGRVLFLGVTPQHGVLGHVVDEGSEVANAFHRFSVAPTFGVFHEVALPAIADVAASRAAILLELGRIHRLGWIDSKQLDTSGVLSGCNAPQCGGFTLEAELGIPKNSHAEPDFMGWEVKQHGVTDFSRPATVKAITLMTPEPDGGVYASEDIATFIRRFGYADRNGVEDRMNFGGVHRVGERCDATGLTMELRGYDAARSRITDPHGFLALVDAEQTVAASWSFRKILEHWSRKHARAVYVPSNSRTDPVRQYRYGPSVRMAEKTDALRLLKALASRAVYYDPGIKLERASTESPSHKKRSQFRVSSKNIGTLYETVLVEKV